MPANELLPPATILLHAIFCLICCGNSTKIRNKVAEETF